MGYLDDTGLTRVWGKFKENISSYKTIENTSIATFTDGSNLPLKSLTADITAIQDLHGYDYPWVGGSGRNLFNMGSKVDGTIANITYTSDDEYLYMNGTKQGGGYADLTVLQLTLSAGTYYLKAITISGTASNSVELYPYDGSANLTSSIINTERTLTLEEEKTFRFRFAIWTDGTVLNNYKLGIVISKTANIDKFYPYSNECPISGWNGVNVTVADATTSPTVSNVYTLTFTDGSNPLTVYGGTVDLVSGVLTVDRGYDVYDGSNDEDWRHYGGNRVTVAVDDFTSPASGITANIMCDKLKTISKSQQGGAEYVISGSDEGYHQFMVNVGISDITELRTWLSNNPITVVYPLATPLTYQLSKQQIRSLVGENNIFASTGAIKKVEYQPDNIVGELREDIDAITDDKVKQTNTTTDASYNVLFSSSTNTTTEKTEGTRKSANLQFNPNKGALTVGTRGTGDVGAYSYTFGYGLKATNSYTHAEGYLSEANGQYSHAEGSQSKTTSGAWYQHAEGQSTTASGDASHSEGGGTTAVGDYSHAQGLGTYATSKSQHVFGEYNIKDGSDSQRYRGEYVEVVGCGDSETPKNARTLSWTGNEWLLGALTTTDVIKTAKWDGTNTSLQTAITAIINSLPTSTTSNGWYITKFPNIKFAICRYINTTKHTGGTKSYSTARSPFTFKNATVSVSAMVAGTVETQIKYTNVATNGVEAYVYSSVTSETNARVVFTVFTDYD